MSIEREHSTLGRWILKNIFKIDLDEFSSEQRASLALLHEASVQKQQLHDTVLEKEAEIDDLKREHKNVVKSAEYYKYQLESCKSDLSSLKKLWIQLEEQHKKLQDDFTIEQQELVTFKRERLALQSQVSEAERMIKELKSTINQKERELAEAHTASDEIEQLRHKLSVATSAKTELESQLTKLREYIVSLEQRLADKDLEIEGLKAKYEIYRNRLNDVVNENDELQKLLSTAKEEKRQLEIRLVELDKAQQSAIQNDGEDENLKKQVKILAQSLNEAESAIQSLNEELTSAKEKIKEYETTIAALNQKYSDNLETLITRLREKDDIISQQADRIKELETELARMSQQQHETDNVKHNSSDDPSEEEESDPTYFPLATSQQSDEGSHPRDLPTIEEDDSNETNRSIQAVIDIQTGEHIDANAFFRRPRKEISTISRQIEIYVQCGGKPFFICEKCHQPVRISKKTHSKGESLFFSHCQHDVDCEWKTTSHPTIKPLYELDEPLRQSSSSEISRYDYLRGLIVDALTKQKEHDDNITIVKPKYKLTNGIRSWRRYDVYVKWHGLDIVFKLQRSIDYLQDLESHDRFCKQNKHFIIWVFGSDSASSYNYLLEHNYQNTMFDNQSCVFILDSEAERACIESGELKLKCNWLIDGKHWFYTLEKSQSNGVLVSLNDLCFDNTESYKPYCRGMGKVPDFDAAEIVNIKPGVYKYRLKSLWGIFNSESNAKSDCKYKEIYVDEQGRIRATIDDMLEKRKGFLSDEGIEIPTTKEEISPGIYVLNIFEHLCIADKNNHPRSHFYESIKLWCDDRLIIQNQDGYGIMSYYGRVIVKPKYQKLRLINDGEKASVTDHSGKYYIDCNGNIIPDEIIPLHNRLKKVRHLGKWGIMNSIGEFIVNYQYNEIASFRNRFFGFTDTHTLIKLENVEKFNYRVPFKAKFVGISSKGDYLFTFDGIEMIMKDNQYNHAIRKEGVEYPVLLINMLRDDQSHVVYYITAYNEKTKDVKFVPTDSDSDYELGQKLTGKVVKMVTLQNKKRLFVEFKDKRQTYINIRLNDAKNYRIGSSITLEKSDYDPFYEITKWKVIN